MADGKINPKMRATLEWGPILAFLVAFFTLGKRHFTLWGADYSGVVLATLVFVPLLLASTLALWRMTGRLSVGQIVTLVVVAVFGGLTLWFNDPRFIKMKPTIIYIVFAAILGFGLLRGKSYLALVMEGALPLTDQGWRILTGRFAGLFLGLAALNEIIWRNFSDQVWVSFKTFGLMALIFLFMLAQQGLLKRHAKPDDKADQKGA